MAQQSQQRDYTYERKTSEDSLVTLTVTVSQQRFVDAKNAVLKNKKKSIKLPGFRPGKAPESMIEATLGTDLVNETLESLLPSVTLEIIKEEKLEPITRVDYSIGDVQDKIQFTASFIAFPDVSLKNLKKVKVKKDKVAVTEKDIDKAVEDMINQSTQNQEDGKNKKKIAKTPDDEWAKSLGVGAKSLADLRGMIKEEIKRQKEQAAQQKYMDEIVKESVEKTEIKAPSAIVDKETERREQEYRSQIENLGIKIEDFLRNQKLSMGDMKKKWKEEAEIKVKSELLFAQIAREYQLKVSDEEVAKEMSTIQDPKLKAQYDNKAGKDYVRNVLAQQKALRKLISIVEGTDPDS